MSEPYWSKLCKIRHNFPEDDTISYRRLVLHNDMQVFLVNDPAISESTCAMAVNIGDFSAPDDLPGLAYLCSRVIILGTQKYPTHNGFHNYISNLSNDKNKFFHAEIGADLTLYYFKVKTESFIDVLLQFAHFFSSALLKEEWIKEEIDKIDCLHKTWLKVEERRSLEFVKYTANTDHPYQKFLCGNKETLETIPKQRGIDVRKSLLEFYEQYYSANVMSLSILSNESLDKVEEMVVNLFCTVPNMKTKISVPSMYPFEDKFCTIWHLMPLENKEFVLIKFPLPAKFSEDSLVPLIFLTKLLTYSGKGSFFEYFSKKFPCKNITSTYLLWMNNVHYLNIQINTATPINTPILDYLPLLFEFFDMIQTKCNQPDGLLPKLYEMFINQARECCSVANTPDIKYTTNTARMLHKYKIEEIPLKRKPKVTLSFSLERSQSMIKWLLKDFITPDHITVYVFSKTNGVLNRVSPEWLGKIQYSELKISNLVIDKCKNISNQNFDLDKFSLDEFSNHCGYTSYILRQKLSCKN